jgi:competence ComEA-like helix-hairpin-helix protein
MVRISFATRRALFVLFCSILLVAGISCIRLARRTPPATAQSARRDVREEAPLPRVRLNTASPEELEKLPGVGRALAARIIEHRARYGPFRRAEHLLMVRGISDRRFRKMRTMIELE